MFKLPLFKKVPSSALGYAISFMLLIGLVASGVLFISSANKRLERHHNMKENLLMNNYFALIHGARSQSEGKQQIIHASGDTSEITRRDWGAFRVIVAETHHKVGSVNKSAIVGYETDETHPALYVPERKQTIKLCGETRIEGTAFIGERGAERGHIAGQSYKGDKLIYGKLKRSERSIPGLKSNLKNENIQKYRENCIKIDPVQKDTTFAFSEPTRLVTLTDQLFLQNSISGNVILHSFDTIVVMSNCQLENVILIAPNVRFESGFKGSVQVIAHETIRLGEDVKLNYPSALILNEEHKNESLDQHGIFLGENAQVLGGVLLFSQKPNPRKALHLKLENARIGGLVYNLGETELNGEVIGYLYTNQFTLRAGGGQYTNHLLNAKISSDLLPKEMIVPNWLTNSKVTKPKLIACF
ncbi:MAG: hypothetical protein P8P74_11395 [Crocinitomicaceae bacterium]|nr:hypothetical protein [Crocinitomicaceae bacterium]